MVHKYRLFDTNIVIDINCNAVYELDDAAFAVLDAYRSTDDNDGPHHQDDTSDNEVVFEQNVFYKLRQRFAQQDLDGAKDEIDSMIEAGALFAKPVSSEDLNGLAQTQVLKSMCLHVAHSCNMTCEYCFASCGDFGMKQELMPFETAKRAIDFITDASGGRRNIEIDFFGGEPLLNFDVVQKTVAYARSIEADKQKNFRFTMTTNGTLLDSGKIQYINENMDNLVLSLDGRKTVNDRLRKMRNGSGSYDAAVPFFQEAVQNRGDKSYYLRGTYTAYNKDFSNDVLHLADLGFQHVSVEPVVSPTDQRMEFSDADMADVLREYESLALAMEERNRKGKGFHFFHFNVDLTQGPCLARRLKGCGAGCEYVAVAPNGDIYPCHQFVGNDAFLLGNLETGITNEKVVVDFMGATLNNKPLCQKCWAKYFCSGGCAANSYHYNQDIMVPNPFYCALLKKRMECAVWLKTREAPV